MNLLFAYVLITGALVMTPRALSESESYMQVWSSWWQTSSQYSRICRGSSSGDIVGAKIGGEEWRAADPKSFRHLLLQAKVAK